MAVMADKCPDLQFTVVDTNPERVASWNSDNLPVYEPGLQEVISRTLGRNHFIKEDTPQHISESDMIYVSDNNPNKELV